MSRIFNPLEGTAPDGEPLCPNCKLSFVSRDSRGDIAVFCQALGSAVRVQQKIIHCTKFYPSNEPWLHEYEGLAWVWTSDGRGDPAFVRLRDLFSGPCAAPPTIGFGRGR